MVGFFASVILISKIAFECMQWLLGFNIKAHRHGKLPKSAYINGLNAVSVEKVSNNIIIDNIIFYKMENIKT